ncbi:NifU family protein [bacterium SCSIO 12643]|nr:NifU family protein [bacterium SCSIO 12643]
MSEIKEIEDRVRNVLNQIRPYLIEDGGDLELIEVSEELVAKIELKGNCTSCSLNSMTFKNSIEDSIFRAVPEVKSVEAINFTLMKPQI